MPVSLVGNTLLGIFWCLKRHNKSYSHLCAICTVFELHWFSWCIILLLRICFQLKLLWKQKKTQPNKKTPKTKTNLAFFTNAVWQHGLRSPVHVSSVGMAGYPTQRLPFLVNWDLSRPSRSSLVSALGDASLAWLQQAGSSGSSPTSAAVSTSVGFQNDKSWLKRCKTTWPYMLMHVILEGSSCL